MYRDISYLQYKCYTHHGPYTETKCLYRMESPRVQKAFVFHANRAYQYRGALYHYRDHMMYLFFNLDILARLPDGGGVSGEVGAGVGGTAIAAERIAKNV